MELNEIRKEINKLNQDLLTLFEKRMELCKAVAEYKKEHQMEIFVPKREKEIIDWVKSVAKDNLSAYDEEFFNTLMALSREYQKTVIED